MCSNCLNTISLICSLSMSSTLVNTVSNSLWRLFSHDSSEKASFVEMSHEFLFTRTFDFTVTRETNSFMLGLGDSGGQVIISPQFQL